MNLAGRLLHWAGWHFDCNVKVPPKCVICVAPHTSNWDFIIGELAIRSQGLKAGFLMKNTWFCWPMGYVMRGLGGIPVKQHEHTNVTAQVVEEFEKHEQLAVAVTPEGTRSRTSHWHKGFLHIAREAGVPVLLAYIDYSTRTACIDRIFTVSDDVDADLEAVKQYYSTHSGKHPENFAV